MGYVGKAAAVNHGNAGVYFGVRLEMYRLLRTASREALLLTVC